MDSISQAVWGALTAQAVAAVAKTDQGPHSSRSLRSMPPVWLIGAVGGTLPDLDVLMRSSLDPLFATLMHRHFTHAIAFTPFGGLILWLALWPWLRSRRGEWVYWGFLCWSAYATHWILDLLTAYGTMIFWPFSGTRYFLDWLSIIDPLLTLPWLAACLAVAMSRSLRTRRLLLISVFSWTAIYILWAGTQHHRALLAIEAIAKSRGHTIERVRALPSLANSFWFRGLYLSQGEIHVIGVLIPPADRPRWREGNSTHRLTEEAIGAEIQRRTNSPVTRDSLIRQAQIWRDFTDDWMYQAEPNGMTIGDARYSSDVTGFRSLWALTLDLSDASKSRRGSPGFDPDARSPFEGFGLLIDQTGLREMP